MLQFAPRASARHAGEGRVILFLQGMASQFMTRLADEMSARGHRVRRINFNGGDALFWGGREAAQYRGGVKRWPAFFETRLKAWAVTDVVLFGDSRPLHAAAIPIARAHGVAVHVIEEGYIRPNCITVEADGVNGHSGLPRDPAWYRAQAALAPPWEPGVRFHDGFARRAVEDVAYNAAAIALSPLYPGYRTHRPWHPLVEYVGWISRLVAERRDRRRSAMKIRALKASGRPYYLFPLQLDCDTQIRIHSPFGRLEPAIAHVAASFAAHAARDSLLILKEHPLDNRLTDWGAVIDRVGRELGVRDRLVFIEDAPLESVLGGAQGVVTVNSTVGVLALASGLPVKALGDAVYDMPTLTYQGDLDRFWDGGAPPDSETFAAFRRVLMQHTQVNGSFFSEGGLRMAVAGAADRIEGVAAGHPVIRRAAPRPRARVAA